MPPKGRPSGFYGPVGATQTWVNPRRWLRLQVHEATLDVIGRQRGRGFLFFFFSPPNFFFFFFFPGPPPHPWPIFEGGAFVMGVRRFMPARLQNEAPP